MKVALVTISLKKTEDGGKSMPIGNGGDFSCPAIFPEIEQLSQNAWDCRILLSKINRSINPGETVPDVPIAFLSPKAVFKALKVGSRLHFWEGRIFASGVVTGFKDEYSNDIDHSPHHSDRVQND